MIERSAKEAVLRLASQFAVVGITGPRQSGKTTLARSVFPAKPYVSFDDKNTREMARSNPGDFLLAFPDGVVIDEAQKVPDIFDSLKLAVDNLNPSPGTYILTGSGQFRLKHNMTDSLAGRAAFCVLLPFSAQELSAAERIPEQFYDFIFKGQYPPLYDPSRSLLPEDWFESYIDTYLSRDVAEMINPSNLSVFQKFLRICAVHSGQIVSMDSMARDIGISAPTVKSWLSILEQSYIIHFLEPDTNNLGRTLVKSPKLYFVDTGLLCHLLRLESVSQMLLDRMKGAIVETYVVSELLKSRTNMARKSNLTYFRDRKGFEVDLIADWKHTYAMEIKSDSATEAAMSAGVRKYLSLRADEETRGVVCYTGEKSMEINGIRYIPWKDIGQIATE